MDTNLKYAPIFRGRQQEIIVLKSFPFGDRIYPVLEIIKELDRKPATSKKKGKTKPKPEKTFESVYLPLIDSIPAKHVFIDIPVHIVPRTRMKSETLQFLRTVAGIRSTRTEYMMKFASKSDKVIPVISTYFSKTNEVNSIIKQEKDLRPTFKKLAFRTFPASFSNDIAQIKKIAKATDYVIIDFAEKALDLDDEDQLDIIDELQKLNCSVIVHRCSISSSITNVGLNHGRLVSGIDNSLLDTYEEFGGTAFSDHVGIKKDDLNEGGTISPGFIYYDATKNQFYGYKGLRKNLDEYERTIVPAVISSSATTRMSAHSIDFLGAANAGWQTIQEIDMGVTSGKSPARFKWISMQHYLHCLKARIENGDFD